MSTSIFINLPVKDVQASRAFFGAIGHTFNEDYSDETTVAMPITDSIVFLLHEPSKFEQFTAGVPTADTRATVSALYALDASSRDEVDDIVTKAVAAGATEPREAQDHGFMYGRSYADLDGHVWEIVWMDPTQMPA